MLPDPLHPAAVHVPIALAVLIPALAVLWILAIRLRLLPSRSWAAILLLQAVLVGSSWLALSSGESEEERVERVVAESRIEEHEEAAERFMVLAVVALAVLASGLLPGATGAIGRVAGTAAALVVLAAGWQVGHSGGELVYRHGAASAYVGGTGAVGASGEARSHEEHEREEGSRASRRSRDDD